MVPRTHAADIQLNIEAEKLLDHVGMNFFDIAASPAQDSFPRAFPGPGAPAPIRDCGRFAAVSKTVDGGNVVREFESLPLR